MQHRGILLFFFVYNISCFSSKVYPYTIATKGTVVEVAKANQVCTLLHKNKKKNKNIKTIVIMTTHNKNKIN